MPPGLCVPNTGGSELGGPIDAVIASGIITPFTQWAMDRIRLAAVRCLQKGYRRIALYGAGRHSVRLVRQPWAEFDVQVVAVIDDEPRTPTLRGVPVVRPHELRPPVDAIVASSDVYEEQLLERARAAFAPGRSHAFPAGLPVLPIYGHAETNIADVRRRLIERWDVDPRDADWLLANRYERHDATLPMLPPERTELHLRRYELAAALARGRACLDLACGTGYGSRVLRSMGGCASYIGIDIDARTIEYAQRRFGDGAVVRFQVGSATQTGLPTGSVDLLTSFETIEHVPDLPAFMREAARVLRPGGVFMLSTPNDGGLTPYHVHSLTCQDIARVITHDRLFEVPEFFAQRAREVGTLTGVGEGTERWIEQSAARAEHILALAVRSA